MWEIKKNFIHDHNRLQDIIDAKGDKTKYYEWSFDGIIRDVCGVIKFKKSKDFLLQ